MFCKFCGKELQDGEVCGCAGSQQAAAAQAQQTSGAAQAATDQMSGQADAAGAQGTQFNTAQMQQKARVYAAGYGSGRKCMEESAWHL